MRKLQIFAVLATVSTMLLPTRALATCCVDTNTCSGTSVSTNHATMGDTPCHTVTITGSGGCEVIVDDDGSVASGDCLTIGRGVKVTGNNHTIDCTAASGNCGTGIKVSGSGSGTTIVNNINITGPWTVGADNDLYDTQASQANYVDVNLENSTGATAGITGFKNIDVSTVQGIPNGSCVILRGGASVSASNLHGCKFGIYSRTAATNVCQNSYVHDVDDWIAMQGSAYYTVDTKGCTFADSPCGCAKDNGDCYADIVYCMAFSGANVSFLDNQIRQ